MPVVTRNQSKQSKQSKQAYATAHVHTEKKLKELETCEEKDNCPFTENDSRELYFSVGNAIRHQSLQHRNCRIAYRLYKTWVSIVAPALY